jgi:murein DD-endopeptidase MepM/ murein hydrolase activator NlpD
MTAPALQAAGVALGGRSLLPRALAAAGLALPCLLLLVVAPLGLLSSGGGSGPEGVPDGIPAAFVPIYRESAAAFGLDWLVLASVHQEETGFSTHPTTYRGLNSAGCCAGPFQFNVTNGPPTTWDGHKSAFRRGRRPDRYPQPQTPHPSVYDNFDAGMAAGSLLRANGADRTLGERTFRAVRVYNGTGPVADAYARRVLDRARQWQAQTALIGGGDVALPPAAAVPGGGALHWPVRGPLTSPFGMRWGRLHAGIDIAAPAGAPILAAATGRVTTRGPVGGYGLLTCLDHAPPYSTCYAHQSRLGPTPVGGIVVRGALVGYVGCTGHCLGAHLHFEVRISGRPVDPLPYLARSG